MQIPPGTTIGRYRVIEEIGSGGMGVVYSAHDTVLDRPVALKFIASTYDLDDTNRRRLRREARAASQLDHTNICTIHEIGETTDGQPFIAMTYYDGQSLKNLMKRGSFDERSIVDLGLQVARGLAHAHQRGVVHRDVKPGNLWVTEDGTVKILDFGIAHRSDLEAGDTGPPLGTASYMSPEQLSGDDVDGRTDVWSFGVVMYRLLSGRLPFRGHSEAAIMYRIVNHEPDRLDASGKVGTALADVVHRCLRKSREERFTSGTELLQALEEATGASGTSEIGFLQRHRRLAIAGGLVVLLGLLAPLTPPGQRLMEQLLAGVFSSPARYVAVLPFEAAESAYATDALGLTHSLTGIVTELAAGDETLWVLPFVDMMNAGIVDVAEARRLYPVDLVIRGNVRDSAGRRVLDLEVVDARPAEPRVLSAASASAASEADVRAAVQRLLADPVDLERPSRGIATRGDTQESPAYPLYTSGLGYLQSVYLEGNLERATRLFQDAVALDSTFAPAYAGLCQARWERYVRSGRPAQADTASAMCEEAVSRSRSDPRILTALGRTQIQVGRLDEAETTLRRATTLDPTQADPYRWLGLALEEQGEIEDAATAYRQAIRLQPELWIYEFELGLMLHYAERNLEAIEHLERAIELSPENYRGYNALGSALLALGRFGEARSALRSSLDARESVLAYRNLGRLHLRQGSYGDAVDALRRGLALNASDWWSWRWLAQAHHWRGEDEAARTAWERVVELTAGRLAVNPNDADALGGRAEALILLGDVQAGREALDRLMVLGETTAYNAFLTGRLYEILGSRTAAIRLLERAIELGLQRSIVENDPWLAELIRDSLYVGGG